MGFSEDFRELISSYVSTVKYSVLVNGSPSGYITPGRGLRQVLSRLIAKEEEKGLFHGVKICREANPLTYLLYTDDLLVFCKAKEEEALVFWRLFSTYHLWSGQVANFEKSNMFFSKRTPPNTKKAVRSLTRFKEMKEGSIYLGNTLVFGRKKSKDFERLKVRVQEG